MALVRLLCVVDFACLKNRRRRSQRLDTHTETPLAAGRVLIGGVYVVFCRSGLWPRLASIPATGQVGMNCLCVWMRMRGHAAYQRRPLAYTIAAEDEDRRLVAAAAAAAARWLITLTLCVRTNTPNRRPHCAQQTPDSPSR